jgi:hypothetical protein
VAQHEWPCPPSYAGQACLCHCIMRDSLSAEVARASKRTREAFDSYLNEFVLEFERALPEDLAHRREHALAIVSLCVGGLMLARAVADRNLSDLVLRACRQHIVPPQHAQKDLS